MTDKNWDSWQERTAGEEVSRRWTLSNDQYLGNLSGNIRRFPKVPSQPRKDENSHFPMVELMIHILEDTS